MTAEVRFKRMGKRLIGWVRKEAGDHWTRAV